MADELNLQQKKLAREVEKLELELSEASRKTPWRLLHKSGAFSASLAIVAAAVSVAQCVRQVGTDERLAARALEEAAQRRADATRASIDGYLQTAGGQNTAPAVRSAAISALGRIGWGSESRDVVAAMLANLLRDDHPQVALSAAYAIGEAFDSETCRPGCGRDEPAADLRRVLYGSASGELGVVTRQKELLWLGVGAPKEKGPALGGTEASMRAPVPPPIGLPEVDYEKGCPEAVHRDRVACAVYLRTPLEGYRLTQFAIAEAVRTNWECLGGAHLAGMDLRGAELYEANLFGANLDRSNLCGANLSDSHFDWEAVRDLRSVALANVAGLPELFQKRALACGAVIIEDANAWRRWKASGYTLPYDWSGWAAGRFPIDARGRPVERPSTQPSTNDREPHSANAQTAP